jgi:hypothetical protein
MNRSKSVSSLHAKLPSGFVTVAYIVSNLEKLAIEISIAFLEIKCRTGKILFFVYYNYLQI